MAGFSQFASAHLLVVAVAWGFAWRSTSGLASAVSVRGVAPEDQSKYRPGTPIQCQGAAGETLNIPFEAVNDEFCDCANGADEPGTGACAGQDHTLFHCPNVGSTPQLLYSSRVDDGICDCCDGSDEAGLQARKGGAGACPNRCAEEGKIEKEERAKRIEELKAGLTKKEENVAAAIKDREQWRADIKKLEEELPALEAALAEAKKVEVANAVPDEKAVLEELRKKVNDQHIQIVALQKELSECKATSGTGDAADIAKPADGEKKQVSEYAKWMDGAGETPGAIEGQVPDDEEDMENGEDEGEHLEEDHNSYSSNGPVVSTASGSKPAQDPAVKAAQDKVSANKAGVEKLEKKLKNVEDDERLGFSSLTKECLSKHDGQYTYKACFYEDAKQDHVSLGRWKGWVGPREAHFTNGQMCPGGPARMLRVLFECGSTDALFDIAEPSRCVYEVRATSPGACDAADQGKLEKPPVKHPKDEL